LKWGLPKGEKLYRFANLEWMVAMTKRITIERHPDNEYIGVISMQDRESKNTFTDPFVDDFLELLGELQTDRHFKAFILRGLPDVFCAGAAKEALLSIFEGGLEVKDLALSEMLINLPVPVIAAMEGAALGGGFVVALCCDIVIMNEKKMYGTNFTNMGFSPGMGCTGLLQALVGDFIANEMMFRGRLMKGREYRGRTLINYILPKEEIMDKAVDIALDIVEKPHQTLNIMKYSLGLPKRKLLAEARVHEDLMHKITFSSPEVKNIIEKMYNG
jgi:polyketide biosynthesis enoyl-CoA hydratase PksI